MSVFNKHKSELQQTWLHVCSQTVQAVPLLRQASWLWHPCNTRLHHIIRASSINSTFCCPWEIQVCYIPPQSEYYFWSKLPEDRDSTISKVRLAVACVSQRQIWVVFPPDLESSSCTASPEKCSNLKTTWHFTSHCNLSWTHGASSTGRLCTWLSPKYKKVKLQRCKIKS